MNAHAERLPRTIQESFVDDHEALLFADLARFNRKLADGRVFTNAERPHHALGQKSPRSFLIEHQPECQRYWAQYTDLRLEPLYVMVQVEYRVDQAIALASAGEESPGSTDQSAR
jgi:hypothetical protein